MAVAGHRAPFVRLFYKDTEITLEVNRFRYVYSEEEDDICEIEVESLDRNMPDSPAFQTKSELKVSWGYIGEPNTIKSRKIYLQDDKWEYGQLVTGSLVFTDKANSISFDTEAVIHKNKTLPEIAKTIADRHGLKVQVGVLQPDTSAVISDILNAEEKTRKAKLKTQAFIDVDIWEKQYAQNRNYTNKWAYGKRNLTNLDGEILDQDYNIKDVDKNTNLPNNFNIYKSIPTGRQSSRVFLQKLAMREKGGNTIIDTRDDNIIIRKRNFNQLPYRTYVWQQEGNELINFTPEYKNRKRAGASNSVTFTGWDPSSKQLYTGNADAVSDNTNDALGNLQYMSNYLSTLPQNQRMGTFELNPLTGRMRYNPTVTNTHSANTAFAGQTFTGQRTVGPALADQVNVIFKDRMIPIVVGEAKHALDKAIENQLKSAQDKTLYDPSSSNPFDSFNNAANARQNANLNKQPATFQIEGDTGIEVGLVISISSTAKKHLGNYYVIQSEHRIDGGAYITTGDLVRDGNNSVTKQRIDVTKFGKNNNTTQGAVQHKYSKRVKNTKQTR